MSTAQSTWLSDVSRETRVDLQTFADALLKWNETINLVSKSSVSDLWTRHMTDSAQLLAFLPQDASVWADFGSGAGFPGLVVALLARDQNRDLEVHLVESDRRKAAFLQSVIRDTKLKATVHCDRVEKLDPLCADVVSARALADLGTLLSYANRHLATKGTALFLKGRTWKAELDSAKAAWRFRHKVHASVTDNEAVILEIGEIRHV